MKQTNIPRFTALAAALILVSVLLLGGIMAFAEDAQPLAATPDEAAATPDEGASSAPLFLQNFTTTDLDGNAIDSSLFAPYELTMINVWATYCQPCLVEMPDLGKLSEDFKDKGVQIVGLVSDAMNYDGSLSSEQIDFAKEIVEKTQANYPHIVPSNDLINILLWQIDSVPTTLFVNSKGDLVDYVYIGSTDYDTWAARIDSALATHK